MKTLIKNLVFIVPFFFLNQVNAQLTRVGDPYITVWDTYLGYNATIGFYSTGDGIYDVYSLPDSTLVINGGILGGQFNSTIITLPSDGVYLVKMYHDPYFNSFPFNSISLGDAPEEGNLKLIRVESWGSINWESFNQMFADCGNLQSIPNEMPNMGSVTSLDGMFRGATFNPDVSGWDVSNVESMYGMFENATTFNQDLSSWNTSKVENMAYMFAGVSSNITGIAPNTSLPSKANGIGGWDVSKVQYMQGIFQNASNFNQDIGGWDVSKVMDMSNMFDGATSFNQDLSNWNTEMVENMSYMFANTASTFNGIAPNSNTLPTKTNGIGGWDVSKVVSMRGMFENAIYFNQDIGGWDVSKVESMEDMFKGAASFNQDLGGWDVSKIDQGYMWENHISFSYSGMDCINYGKTLKGWSQNATTPSNIIMKADGKYYSSADATYRNDLITTNLWDISGDTEDPTCISLSVENLDMNFSIYPNPATTTVNIDGLNGNETIEIIDLSGRFVLNSNASEININGLSNGIYTLIISVDNNKIYTEKLIIK